jgi:hypothetical protein
MLEGKKTLDATLAGCWLFHHPFSQRLWSQQTAAVWLPQDSQTS